MSVSIEVIEVPARQGGPADVPLPRTGWEAGGLASVAFALILLGCLVVLLATTRLERIHA